MTTSGLIVPGSPSAARQAIILAGILVAAGGAATILGAYFFQYVLGYPPCPLCLDQRIPYYITVPLSALPSVQEAWLGALAYTFQLYFDFSAYSDMAIGLSWMFNIRLQK